MGGNLIGTRTPAQIRMLEIVQTRSYEMMGGISLRDACKAYGDATQGKTILAELEGLKLVARDARTDAPTYENRFLTTLGHNFMDQRRAGHERAVADAWAGAIGTGMEFKLAHRAALEAGIKSLSNEDLATALAGLKGAGK